MTTLHPLVSALVEDARARGELDPDHAVDELSALLLRIDRLVHVLDVSTDDERARVSARLVRCELELAESLKRRGQACMAEAIAPQAEGEQLWD